MCSESSEPFLFFCDLKLVKGGRDIQLYKPFYFVYLIESLMDQQQWIIILLHNNVESSIVHTEL